MKFKNIFLFVLLILSLRGYAQDASTYRKQMDQENVGVKKGELCFKLFTYYLNNDIQKAFAVTDELKSVAEKYNNDTIMCRYLQAMGLYYTHIGNTKKIKEYDNRLLNYATKTKNLRFQAICLLNRGVDLDEAGKSKNAILNYEKCLALFRNCNDTANLLFTLLNYGVAESHIGNTVKSKQRLEECIELAKKLPKVSNVLLYAYNQYANLLASTDSKNPLIYSLLDTTLLYSQQLNNKTIELNALGLLAQLYFENNQGQKVYETNLKRIQIAEEQNFVYQQISAYIDCAEAISMLGITDSCYYFLDKAISLAKSSDNTLLLLKAYSTLGNIYENDNNSKEGKKYFLLAHKLYQDNDVHDLNYNTNCERLMSLYTQEGKLDSAAYYLKLLDENSKTHKSGNTRNEYLQRLGKLKLLSGDTLKSAVILDSAFNVLDTATFSISNKTLTEIETKYKVREKDIHLQEAKKQASYEARTKRFFILFSIITCLLAAGLGLLLYKNIQQKRIISRDKANIEILQDDMKHETIRQYNDIVNHATLLYGQNPSSVGIPKLISRIRAYQSLFYTLFSSDNKKELSLEKSILEVFTDNCAGMNNTPAFNCSTSVLLSFSQSESVLLLINELIANSLEHAFQNVQKPAIALNLFTDDGVHCQLVYRDNGIGMEDNNRRLVKGKGMRQIYSLTTQNLRGEINAYNDNGSCYKVKFKIIKDGQKGSVG
ncbi:MAG: hypothetical protein JNM95_07675 [Chitinophagaceae bacterium]|nr:hypothetical protein [Chitinophagaceae bacterium]